MKHCDGNHFEQVVCVQIKQQLVYFGLCKVDTSEIKYMCTRNVKLETDTSSNCRVNVKYCFSKYLRRKRYFQHTSSYHLNDLFRQKVMERNGKKYKESVLVGEKLNQRGIERYKQSLLYKQRVKERSIGKYKTNLQTDGK